MNGVDIIENGSILDRRPIVTCAGELEVFSSLEDALSQTLPQDTCEWKRSHGRPIRAVHIGAIFVPFSSAALPKGNQWDLIRQPLFHIYWTECTDVDVYKVSVRDDIELWLKEISLKDISDWLIVVVENYDGKRANKLLPRTTVLDKIRSDFAAKQGDRCISVINPGRVESRSTDSWKGLVLRIRHLLSVAYEKAVTRFEDHIRQQREKRNEPGWNFMHYFKLQEELAQISETLGLSDEALIQYDELDALFSQFVVNGHNGGLSEWLTQFQKPLERWHGLKLGMTSLKSNPSLLELRAYMFSKQAYMLLLANKIWEMASRCLPFLHTCMKELSLLEISSPPGATSCWLFLACMEVLQICDRFNQADQVESYSAQTAALWEYASQKLRHLGELCGLLPGKFPTSEQLHMVVELSAGMGDCPGSPGQPSPTDKLKEALSSQDAFNKNYLELAELAMGTYKHIGRLRCARLVGRQVASFYLLLGETQKSAAFLGDALRTFQQDNWHELVAQTQLELAECHKKAGDSRKFVRACSAVSAAPDMDTLIRWTHFDEMMKYLDSLDKPLSVPFDNIFKIITVCVKNDGPVIQDDHMELELQLECGFPREAMCTQLSLTLEAETKEHKKAREKNSASNAKCISSKDLKPCDPFLDKLDMRKHLDYKQDKQVSCSSVVCKSAIAKRKDSAPPPQQPDFKFSLDCDKLPLVLTPGLNVIRLKKPMQDTGKYCASQLILRMGKLEFVSASLSPRLLIEVKREEPSVRLDKGTAALLSGLEQTMVLTVVNGSYQVEKGSAVKLLSSRGLSVQNCPEKELVSSLEILVENTAPFEVTRTNLRVLAELPSKEHQITIVSPWATKPVPVVLAFTPPFNTTWRLHTAQSRKFVQITISGQCEKELRIASPKLATPAGDYVHFCFEEPSEKMVSSGSVVSYMWELSPSGLEFPALKMNFSVDYTPTGEDVPSEVRNYQYNFELADYQTLYTIEASVAPAKGNEFCRGGALCHLNLCIKRTGRNLEEAANSLMYEVIGDQSVWAVCGRSAGVVMFDQNDSEPQNVVLDVMPLSTGYLPLPLIRLSKYIPAESAGAEKSKKNEAYPRLEPFGIGQVYNSSKGKQVHVIAAAAAEGHVA